MSGQLMNFSRRQFAVATIFVLLVLAAAHYTSNWLVDGGRTASRLTEQTTLTETTQYLKTAPSVYLNRRYGFSFEYPPTWTVDEPTNAAFGTVAALRRGQGEQPCFDGGVVCRIIVETVANPANKPLESLDAAFYPDISVAYGSTEVMRIGGVYATRFYNVENTGGQYVFIPRDGWIIKFTLRDPVIVSLDDVAIYEQILESLNFLSLK